MRFSLAVLGVGGACSIDVGLDDKGSLELDAREGRFKTSEEVSRVNNIEGCLRFW